MRSVDAQGQSNFLMSERRWGLKNLRLHPPLSIAEIEMREEDKRLQLIFQKGLKEGIEMLRVSAAGLPRGTPIEQIRQIADFQPDEILKRSEEANHGKKDYAYAFGVCISMMKEIAWLANLDEKSVNNWSFNSPEIVDECKEAIRKVRAKNKEGQSDASGKVLQHSD